MTLAFVEIPSQERIKEIISKMTCNYVVCKRPLMSTEKNFIPQYIYMPAYYNGAYELMRSLGWKSYVLISEDGNSNKGFYFHRIS